MWLSPRGWLLAAVVVVALGCLLPVAWEFLEPLPTRPDYRIPYRLGEDYWTYARYCRLACSQDSTLLVGDSVIWGHYIAPEETLSHYLNALSGAESYANVGVDGIHPAAMAGLVEYYGRAIRNKNVVLFCNPLWMSSADHDLRGDRQSFNHPRLIPQLTWQLRCYQEPLDVRLGILLERHVGLLAWAHHLRAAYFDNEDVFAWTMEHPYDNPAGAVTLTLPPAAEPPSPKPVAQPWTAKQIDRYSPPWVDLATSFQWSSFQRTIRMLQSRRNRVFVLVGPFNEHMLEPDSLAAYGRMKAEMAAWLAKERIPYYIPAPLASELYADASHPLARGYRVLASQLWKCPAFIDFRR